jgi:hypothetical protein
MDTFTRSQESEAKYKEYQKAICKVSLEAQMLYYKDLFDVEVNSVEKPSSNLNTVCSSKAKKQDILYSN